ncbi:2-hydroxychromene-2-carboxylate isomerase [Marinobacteraceae bacterium S3BR75-40.1]
MGRSVSFYFDIGSPTSYLAWTQLPDICRRRQATLDYRPVLLGAIFKATGNQSPAMIPAKGRYLMHDLNRFAHRYGVPFEMNPLFPINTLTVMRVLTGCKLHDPGRFDDLMATLYPAMWVEKLNLGDFDTIEALLVERGFDGATLMQWAQDENVKQALKTQTEQAIAKGLFGCPTFFVGDEMFFGQDRLDFVDEALARAD